MQTRYIVLIVLVFFVLAINFITPDGGSEPVPLNVDISQQKQIKREKLISDLKQKGIIQKIEQKNSLPNVFVNDSFKALDDFEKEELLTEISTYYYAQSRSSSMVIIRDSASGEKLGSYSQNGLSLKK